MKHTPKNVANLLYSSLPENETFGWRAYPFFLLHHFLTQSGNRTPDGLAAGPHLLQALLWSTTSRALGELDLIPGILLGLGAHHLLAGRHIEPALDSSSDHVQVEVRQVIRYVGKGPVLAMLARPVIRSQGSHQFVFRNYQSYVILTRASAPGLCSAQDDTLPAAGSLQRDMLNPFVDHSCKVNRSQRQVVGPITIEPGNDTRG
jgi:hypothetical protein